MGSRKIATAFAILLVPVFLGSFSNSANKYTQNFIEVAASDKFQRTQIANSGMSIEYIRSDRVWGFADSQTISELREKGFSVLGQYDASVARGGHQSGDLVPHDFPAKDARYHNYQEMIDALTILTSQNSNISRLTSIGQSLEGRELWAININSTPESLMTGKSNKPGIIITGAHHAREHLSTEIPLMMAEYLLNNQDKPEIAELLDNRDIWIIPMVNPDGVEWDIASGSYRSWRKNRRKNSNDTFGVDLNRNYSYKWGTGGSSSNPNSQTYKGPDPFSEPETQAISNFVAEHTNLKVFLSFHTFSELILYPWGHQFDSIANVDDLAAYEKIATTMAGWNGYTPPPVLVQTKSIPDRIEIGQH